VLVLVWFVALRGHSSSSEGTSSPTSSAAAKPASPAPGSSGSPGGVYHGSAPGVEGLSRAIAKAHGAVTQSQRNAKQLEQKAAQASSPSSGTSASASGGTAAASSPATQRSSSTSASTTKTPSHKGSSPAASRAGQAPAGQLWVERQIKHGAVVALLFYNPKGADDVRTRNELQQLLAAERGGRVSVEGRELGNASVVPEPRRQPEERIVLRVAPASKVGSYGSFTRVATVYQTPTLLVITPGGHIKPALTGLTDAFSIEQAIDEQARP
jgi:hypothetical protein